MAGSYACHDVQSLHQSFDSFGVLCSPAPSRGQIKEDVGKAYKVEETSLKQQKANPVEILVRSSDHVIKQCVCVCISVSRQTETEELQALIHHPDDFT